MMTLLRMAALPVAAHTTFGSDSATAIDPIEPVEIWPSDTGSQERPQFSVFQIPPPVAPM